MLFTALRSKAVDPPGGWAFIAADARSAAALITRMPISVARQLEALQHSESATSGASCGALLVQVPLLEDHQRS